MTSTTEGSLTTPIDGLPGLVGRRFGPSSWYTISQEDVSTFADLSGDHNPVHIDPVFAAGTPFGTTIAHGYLTLSLIVPLVAEVFEVTGVGVGINYGIDRLRFPAPVPTGSRVRAVGEILAADEVPGGYQITQRVTVEIEDAAKPACVVDMLLRYYR